jgi:2-polyprenyl-3-methyl-5-hydroxy-6-metoxy-1,4-benzoquinol methylase
MTEPPSDRGRQPQNVYDDPDFFAGYSQLERFDVAWGTAYEHESFAALLPDVAGSRVLDLGCGAGQLTLHLAQAGAAEVIGIDVSERMLEIARTQRAESLVTYLRASMDEAEFPAGRFELVVSSLALHYVEDYRRLVRRVADWLVPGGVIVFSTEHPMFTARASDDGWIRDAGGEPLRWTIDRYGAEGLREERWFRDGVQKFHRMLATLLNGLVDAGLVIERVVEPMPDEEMLLRRPDWVHELKRPIFLLVRARKP